MEPRWPGGNLTRRIDFPGNVTVGAGSNIIAPGGIGTIGSLSVNGLTLTGNSTLIFDITSSTTLDSLTATGAFGVTAGTVNLAVPTGLTGGTYKLVGYGSTSMTDASSFILNGGVTPSGYSLALNTTNNELDLTVAGAVGPNQWNLPGNGNWGDTTSWSQGTVPNSNAAVANFLTTATGNATVDLQSTSQTVNQINFNNTAASYTISNGTVVMDAASGNASIVFTSGNTKDHAISAGVRYNANTDINAGVNTLTLSGQQDWNGKTVTVQGGTLRYNGATSTNVLAGSTLVVNSGAVALLAGTTSGTSASVNVTNNSTASGGGLQVTGTNQVVGAVSGTGSLTVGPGAVLTTQSVSQSAITVNGTMKVATNTGLTAAGPNVIVTPALVIAGTTDNWTGSLDLANNKLVVQTGSLTGTALKNAVLQIDNQVKSGYNLANGSATVWKGTGINSSIAVHD